MKNWQNFLDSHGTGSNQGLFITPGSNYPEHFEVHIFITVQIKQATVKKIGLNKVKYFYLLLQAKNIYCISKKSCPMLYSNLVYKIGLHFLDIQIYKIIIIVYILFVCMYTINSVDQPMKIKSYWSNDWYWVSQNLLINPASPSRIRQFVKIGSLYNLTYSL